MKKKTTSLKIFSLSHPLLETEWRSLIGDKYLKALQIKWNVVTDINDANVIVWDGVLGPKLAVVIQNVLEGLKQSKVLLLLGESMTIFKDHPMVGFIDLDQIRYVEVPGWQALPEDILHALEECQQKLEHV